MAAGMSEAAGTFFRAVFFSGVPITPVTTLGVKLNDFLVPSSLGTSLGESSCVVAVAVGNVTL